MGPIAAAAVRSGIATIAVVVLLITANYVLSSPADQHGLESALRAITHPTTLISAGIGWLSFSGWLWQESRNPPQASPNRVARIGWAVLTTLLISAGIVALLEVVQAARGAILYFWGIPWRYWLRVFEAALFAVAVVRITLPLIPRFDRMSPRNS